MPIEIEKYITDKKYTCHAHIKWGNYFVECIERDKRPHTLQDTRKAMGNTYYNSTKSMIANV